MSFTYSQMQAALPTILSNIPYEWRGTTFKNSNLLGREVFSEKLKALVAAKGTSINSDDLTELGNAEDYLRVSSNFSSLLETVLSVQRGCDITQVFTFGSITMPIISVLLISSTKVHLYVGENGANPFLPQHITILNECLGCNLEVHHSNAVAHAGEIVLSTTDVDENTTSFIDGVIRPNVLFINNTSNIDHAKLLKIRKRSTIPVTTPVADAWLQSLAGIEVTADLNVATEDGIADFYGHLQTMSGTNVNTNANPVCCTAGLAAIASMYMALIGEGGADILMASTSYGGSSELTDILSSRSSIFNKYNFDITGKNEISASIQISLNSLASDVSKLNRTTVLFVEIPTNPDQKIPDIGVLASILANYETTTGKEVLLVVDTTFAPGSHIMEKVYDVAPNLKTMTFISMSKSVSHGLTTAGTVVAGPSQSSIDLIHKINDAATMLDNHAKKDQIYILSKVHMGCEDRCQRAYNAAVAVGNSLCEAVKNKCAGHVMTLNFVTPEQAAVGFTSSTFSFNLPSLQGASADVNAGLAQKFVDLLCQHKEFKPCVSFGQDNGLIYATVPATSTQGAIKEEDKAKQAVGGVQLTRLSFSPGVDAAYVSRIITDSVNACY
jgi:cysteine synthase A